jgi:glyoxylase-like metal-dependent hydrolase (beta-lactamase superfamily II)/ferredoxin
MPRSTETRRPVPVPVRHAAAPLPQPSPCHNDVMARWSARLPQNAPGDFYVDSTCIDCATCRVVAPQTFAPTRNDLSYVHHQPETEAERRRALMALVACPTASIGTASRQPAHQGVEAFPEPLAGGVYYCGFAAEASFGASSYLVVREGGNVLVDSPRAAGPLMRRVREMGGLRFLFLTHRDDVADHARWQLEFGCERVMHEADVSGDTRAVERRIAGDDPVRLADDLLVIPVPGHTRGSAALLYADTFLFTGDHLMASEDGAHLVASRSVCWYSWPEQLRSLERLLDHRFEWVLPGHGGRYRAASPAAMRRELERLLARLRS